jgi:N6-adenosine-specific RNA methylase IME4
MVPIEEHSKKPEILELIVRLFGDLTRLELFAREKISSWSSWRNEV